MEEKLTNLFSGDRGRERRKDKGKVEEGGRRERRKRETEGRDRRARDIGSFIGGGGRMGKRREEWREKRRLIPPPCIVYTPFATPS